MFNKSTYSCNGLSGLRHYAKTWLRCEDIDFLFAQDNITFYQIFSEPTHFDMPMTADNNGVISNCREFLNLLMGIINERAGGITNLKPRRFCPVTSPV